jgi:DsbC/DsbD-like thiol-disulfide interchange protein
MFFLSKGSICVLLTLCLMPALTRNTHTQATGESHAKVQLIAEEDKVSPGKPLWIGILFELDSGWHIYWQNAGDSGEPPRVRWNLPAGFGVGPIRWPQPKRLASGSVVDYGYEGRVLLMAPLEGPPGKSAMPMVSAEVSYIVCRDICVPGKAQLIFSSEGGMDPARRREIFERGRGQLPNPAPAHWKISAKSTKDHMVLLVQTNSVVKDATFFPSNPGEIENSAAQTFVSTGNGFRLTLQKSDQLTTAIPTLKGLLVFEPGRAYEVSAPVTTR